MIAMGTVHPSVLPPALIFGSIHFVSDQVFKNCDLRNKKREHKDSAQEYSNIAREIKVFIAQQEMKLNDAINGGTALPTTRVGGGHMQQMMNQQGPGGSSSSSDTSKKFSTQEVVDFLKHINHTLSMLENHSLRI